MRLTVDNLSFGYGKRVVGSGVDFTLEPGRVMALLGPNGGGKTTLFKTLLHLLPALDGRVLVDGADVGRWSTRQRARVFGYVPQAQTGFFPFTLLDTVLMGRTAHLAAFASPSRRDRAIAEAMLAEIGLDHLADRPYTEVSGGERQLTLIARALAQEPAILVMDEPTASLDFGNQVRVLERIRALADRRISIILSTHDLDQVFLCADRVALLHAGRLLALGSPEAVITPEHLRTLYGVEVEIVRIADRTLCLARRGR